MFVAANAIHWIEPHYATRRATQLLKPGGTIALVGTADRSQGSAFWQATQPIYHQYNPITLHRESSATMARRVLSAGSVPLWAVWRAPRSPNIVGETVLR